VRLLGADLRHGVNATIEHLYISDVIYFYEFCFVKCLQLYLVNKNLINCDMIV